MINSFVYTPPLYAYMYTGIEPAPWRMKEGELNMEIISNGVFGGEDPCY